MNNTAQQEQLLGNAEFAALCKRRNITGRKQCDQISISSLAALARICTQGRETQMKCCCQLLHIIGKSLDVTHYGQTILLLSPAAAAAHCGMLV